jgi:XRE family transcriptional regulator, aerobic/anaerobic benzoate catabolism transcriptional regulator
MSSTILHESVMEEAVVKNPFLVALGERVRAIRSRKGLTRKALAAAAQVSERHLANLEYGEGNVSVLVLVQIALALHSSLAELLGDVTTSSPEWLLIRELMEGLDESEVKRVRTAVSRLLGKAPEKTEVSARIALIGLRGAGKSTLGRMLASDLSFPFVELSREIERLAGCSLGEIQALYGVNAYRRYERRALAEVIQQYSEVVIATPGGMVADPSTFHEVLTHCTTIWLQAEPEDHMNRVRAQGDLRPMAASEEAMDDLKGILAGRAAFYSQAQWHLNTSAQSLEESFVLLRKIVAEALSMPMQ